MSTDRKAERDSLEARIDELRAFEREYRQRLHLYLEDCMATVAGPDDELPLRAAARRLVTASDADLRVVAGQLPEHSRKRLLDALLRVPVPEVP